MSTERSVSEYRAERNLRHSMALAGARLACYRSSSCAIFPTPSAFAFWDSQPANSGSNSSVVVPLPIIESQHHQVFYFGLRKTCREVLRARKNKKIQLAYYCMSLTRNRESEESKHKICGGEKLHSPCKCYAVEHMTQRARGVPCGQGARGVWGVLLAKSPRLLVGTLRQ